MKKYRNIIAMLAMGVVLTACGGGESTVTQPATVAPATVAEETTAAPEVEAEAVDASEFKAETPVVITSAGQSADFEMIKVMFDKNEIEYTADSVVKVEALEGCKTLVVAIGGSSKGLGAAGIDADAELARVEELLNAAKEKDITIIAAHIGGAGRRGQLGDRYIAPTVTASNYTIVVEAGNEDGLFTQLCTDNSIPLVSVANMTDVIPIIGEIFQK